MTLWSRLAKLETVASVPDLKTCRRIIGLSGAAGEDQIQAFVAAGEATAVDRFVCRVLVSP